MSIDISKIIQVYEGCLTLLKAKQNLSIDSQDVNALLLKPEINRIEQNFYVAFIQDGILQILKTWEKKFSLYHHLQDQHKLSYSQLHFKMESLQNNSEIVTREDQLLAEIQQMMASWRQNMDPTEYYNSKFRKLFKTEMQQKLQSLKHCMNKNYNVTAPLYTKRVENQFKQNVMATYQEETKIDRILVDTTISIHDELAQLYARLDDLTLQKLQHKQISSHSNSFLNDIYDILSRNSRPSDRRLSIYTNSLSQAIKKNYLYWSNLRKSLDHLMFLITQVFKSLASVKSNLGQKQQLIHRLLLDVPKPIGNIFRVPIIHNLIKSFNSSFEASQILIQLRNKILKRKQFAIKNEGDCINYSNQIVHEANQRYENFHHFALIDKKFFEDQSKAEKVITKLIIQNFKQFLQACYGLTKKIRKVFTDYCQIQEIGSEELDAYLSRLIINDMDDLSCKDQSTTLSLTESACSIQRQKQKEKEADGRKSDNLKKITKIQQFINSIQLFKSDSMSENQKFFSCALGPKLLLHGKLYVLPEGIFFQSHFNKKNLLFGKTKLFIPKSQIVQIDMKNTLVVFPDAVLVKTQHGLVSFHALGHRKIISSAIKQAYIGENSIGAQQSNGPTQVLNFKPMDISKKPNQATIQNASKNLESVIYETILKGSNLGNVFKRYFSDQKFVINGKQYDIFKSFSLGLIDAKNPKSTALSPPPPIYFTLTNEKDPENPYPTTSVRQHIYGKDLPKIPFISKGGEGQCCQKQTYRWLGPDIFVIDVVSTVKGFSLTQGMEVLIKYVIKQIGEGVKVTISLQIKFAKQSSSNGMVRGPTLSKVKQSMSKIFGVIQKCERLAKLSSTKLPAQEQNEILACQPLNQTTQTKSNASVQLSKQQLIYIAIGFAVFYIITIALVKAF